MLQQYCSQSNICQESFQTVWKVFEQSRNFPEKYSIVCSIVATSISYTFVTRVLACMSRKRFTHFWHIYVAKAIYALLAHTCRENDLRTPSGKFFSGWILPTGKFGFFVSLLWLTNIPTQYQQSNSFVSYGGIRATFGKLASKITPPGGKMCIQCKLHHLVAKFATWVNSSLQTQYPKFAVPLTMFSLQSFLYRTSW